MSNEMIWLLFALLNFSMIVLCYKLFGKTGLFAWIAMGTVIANIQVVKMVELFGMTATLGNIMFGTLFLATDLINEKYGLKTAKKAVYIGFFALISVVVIMQVALQFDAIAESLIMQSALLLIFGLIPRIALASIVAYFISQLFDVYVFQKIKEMLPKQRLLFVRNIGSTAISQLLDTAIFVPIAFIGVVPNAILIDILITTYIIKLLVALLDTPFIYLMVKIQPLSTE